MRNIQGPIKLFPLLLLLAGIAVFTLGCESGTSSGVTAYSVQYIVLGDSLDGSALITRVTYDDESGTQTLDLDPAVASWSTVVILAPGDTIYLYAEGTLVNGRLRIQAQVQADDGSIFARSNDSMSYQTADDEPIWIDRETLP